MHRELEGRTAIVSGGAVGIGYQICQALADKGVKVGYTYHAQAPNAAVGWDRDATVARLDVTDSHDVRAAMRRMVDGLGGTLNILIVNAGGLIGRSPIATMSDDHWRQTVEVNLTSAFYCVREALPFMQGTQGRIVIVSSQAAFDGGGPGAAAYAAAKAGLIGLTRGLAKEVADNGITVNAVAPGFIGGTAFHDRYTPLDRQTAIVKSIPVGRAGTSSDVAAAVCFLASDQASFMTGTVLHVNGGAWPGG